MIIFALASLNAVIAHTNHLVYPNQYFFPRQIDMLYTKPIFHGLQCIGIVCLVNKIVLNEVINLKIYLFARRLSNIIYKHLIQILIWKWIYRWRKFFHFSCISNDLFKLSKNEVLVLIFNSIFQIMTCYNSSRKKLNYALIIHSRVGTTSSCVYLPERWQTNFQTTNLQYC